MQCDWRELGPVAAQPFLWESLVFPGREMVVTAARTWPSGRTISTTKRGKTSRISSRRRVRWPWTELHRSLTGTSFVCYVIANCSTFVADMFDASQDVPSSLWFWSSKSRDRGSRRISRYSKPHAIAQPTFDCDKRDIGTSSIEKLVSTAKSRSFWVFFCSFFRFFFSLFEGWILCKPVTRSAILRRFLCMAS